MKTLAPIVPNGAFPATEGQYLKGSLAVFATKAAMDATPVGRQSIGQIAYAQDTGNYYKLTAASTWTVIPAPSVLRNGFTSTAPSLSVVINTVSIGACAGFLPKGESFSYSSASLDVSGLANGTYVLYTNASLIGSATPWTTVAIGTGCSLGDLPLAIIRKSGGVSTLFAQFLRRPSLEGTGDTLVVGAASATGSSGSFARLDEALLYSLCFSPAVAYQPKSILVTTSHSADSTNVAALQLQSGSVLNSVSSRLSGLEVRGLSRDITITWSASSPLLRGDGNSISRLYFRDISFTGPSLQPVFLDPALMFSYENGDVSADYLYGNTTANVGDLASPIRFVGLKFTGNGNSSPLQITNAAATGRIECVDCYIDANGADYILDVSSTDLVDIFFDKCRLGGIEVAVLHYEFDPDVLGETPQISLEWCTIEEMGNASSHPFVRIKSGATSHSRDKTVMVNECEFLVNVSCYGAGYVCSCSAGENVYIQGNEYCAIQHAEFALRDASGESLNGFLGDFCLLSGNIDVKDKAAKGTVTCTNGSDVVTGSGTFFTEEISVGDIVRFRNGTTTSGEHTIDAINNDGSLVINSTFGSPTTTYTLVYCGRVSAKNSSPRRKRVDATITKKTAIVVDSASFCCSNVLNIEQNCEFSGQVSGSNQAAFGISNCWVTVSNAAHFQAAHAEFLGNADGDTVQVTGSNTVAAFSACRIEHNSTNYAAINNSTNGKVILSGCFIQGGDNDGVIQLDSNAQCIISGGVVYQTAVGQRHIKATGTVKVLGANGVFFDAIASAAGGGIDLSVSGSGNSGVNVCGCIFKTSGSISTVVDVHASYVQSEANNIII